MEPLAYTKNTMAGTVLFLWPKKKKKKVSKSLDTSFSIEGFLEVMASSKGKSAAPVLWSTVQIVSY